MSVVLREYIYVEDSAPFRGCFAMPMIELTPAGDIPLPSEMRDRHGFLPGAPIRVVETRSGVLLISAASRELDPEFAAELEAWQVLAATSLSAFTYEE